MKVRCVRLLSQDGREIASDPWLKLGEIYHVLSIFIADDGARSYSIVSRETLGEWPQMVSHQAKCFEIVSAVTPSNWRPWLHSSGAIGISPIPWQTPEFAERFFEHDPATYPIFVQERDVILREDP